MVDLTDDLRIIRFVDRPFTAGADHLAEEDLFAFRIPCVDRAAGFERVGGREPGRCQDFRIRRSAGLERLRGTAGGRFLSVLSERNPML